MAHDRVANLISNMGTKILFNTDVESIESKVEGVLRDNGQRIDTDMVIIGKGVKPNRELVEGSEAKIGRGISSIGICALLIPFMPRGTLLRLLIFLRNENRVNALWPIACEQGIVAGYNMSGYDIEYPGAIPMNALSLEKMNLFSIDLIWGSETETQRSSTEGSFSGVTCLLALFSSEINLQRH
jgi:NAD(P)H-nitrite reductase large subunit